LQHFSELAERFGDESTRHHEFPSLMRRSKFVPPIQALFSLQGIAQAGAELLLILVRSSDLIGREKPRIIAGMGRSFTKG
jgi:hypothetical protein